MFSHLGKVFHRAKKQFPVCCGQIGGPLPLAKGHSHAEVFQARLLIADGLQGFGHRDKGGRRSARVGLSRKANQLCAPQTLVGIFQHAHTQSLDTPPVHFQTAMSNKGPVSGLA